MQDMHLAIEQNQEKPNSHRAYSENEIVNEMLDRYSDMMAEENTWFSVDAYGIPKGQKGMFCEVLEMALEEAAESCFHSTPPRGRYIKVRSRNAHRKLFVLISYSCQSDKPVNNDLRLSKLREMLTGKSGYFRFIQSEEDDEASIQISVPCRLSC